MTATALRAWRLDMHLTQKKAAELLGVGWKTYQHYELGRKIPRHVEITVKLLRTV